jgi:hypothetical protein
MHGVSPDRSGRLHDQVRRYPTAYSKFHPLNKYYLLFTTLFKKFYSLYFFISSNVLYIYSIIKF